MEKVLRGLVANGGLSTMGQALGFAASLVEERCVLGHVGARLLRLCALYMTYIMVLIRVERTKAKDNREFTLGYQPFAYTRLTVCLYSNGCSPILKCKSNIFLRGTIGAR